MKSTDSTRGRALCRSGISLIFLTAVLFSAGYAQEYGRRPADDDMATVWWAEGAHKVMKDDPSGRNPNGEKKKLLCGPVNSVRWEILREGIEDYEYFRLQVRMGEVLEALLGVRPRRAASEEAAWLR